MSDITLNFYHERDMFSRAFDNMGNYGKIIKSNKQLYKELRHEIRTRFSIPESIYRLFERCESGNARRQYLLERSFVTCFGYYILIIQNESSRVLMIAEF